MRWKWSKWTRCSRRDATERVSRTLAHTLITVSALPRERNVLVAMNVLRTRMAGLRQAWKKTRETHPRLAWTLSSLVWLPTGIAFTQYFYSLRLVSGRSMQVLVAICACFVLTS